MAGTWPSYWLDPFRVYVLTFPPNTTGTSPNLYLLNTKNGANQTIDKLSSVLVAPGGGLQSSSSYDISPDGKQLFIGTCTCGPGGKSGLSSITVQPATGGSQRTIFTTQTLTVTAIHAISSTSLLLFGEDTVDNVQIVYKVQTDGTGFTKLASHIIDNGFFFSPDSTQDWSSISRDKSMYTLTLSYCGLACQVSLLFGSLKGGTPTQFVWNVTAIGSFSSRSEIAGWTTI